VPVPARTLVLAHSPLTGAAAWGELPDVLRERGHEVVLLDVTDDVEPSYASRYVARAAVQIAAARPARPVHLVGHSGAGYLLPQIGAARRSARERVAGYVFLDAGAPHGRDATRLTLLRAEDPAAAGELEGLLERGGRFPPWRDEDLRELVPDDARRAALVASLRPRGVDFFTETLPYPGDWPDAPCGFLKLSSAYDVPARVARSRGWPVVSAALAGGHFAPCTDPIGVAAALEDLLTRM
jgi:pimeloyl-ACP methyl ester carboxylesterase